MKELKIILEDADYDKLWKVKRKHDLGWRDLILKMIDYKGD